MSLGPLAVLLLVIATALAFDFINGFHDISSAMTTFTATGALKPKTAVMLSALSNLVRAFLFMEMVLTVTNAVVNPQDDVGAPRSELFGDGGEGLLLIVLSGLMGAILWNPLTWLRSLPSSSSHALFDGPVGVTIAGLGIGGVNQIGGGARLDEVVGEVILPALVSSVVAVTVSGVGTWLALTITRGTDGKRRERGFRWEQVGSASLIPLAHDTNDAQKTMGVITLVLTATGNWVQLHAVPFWMKVVYAVVTTLGTYLRGQRIIRILGKGLVEINSPWDMAADASPATVILASGHMGFALSTMHVATELILGSGLGRSSAKMNWRVTGKVLMPWAVTLSAVALMGAVMWSVGHLLGGLFGALAIFVILLAVASLMYLHSRKSITGHNNVNDEWVESITAPRSLAATTEVADLIELKQPEGNRARESSGPRSRAPGMFCSPG